MTCSGELYRLTFTYLLSCCDIVELLSHCPVVDSPAVAQSPEPDAVGVGIMTLDQCGEMSDVGQTLQLPDGTVAVIKNLSQCQYRCRLLHCSLLALMILHCIM